MSCSSRRGRPGEEWLDSRTLGPITGGRIDACKKKGFDAGARPANFCPKARDLKFDAILKKRNLGAWRRSCQSLKRVAAG